MCHHFCHDLRWAAEVKRAERLHALSEMLRRHGPRGCTAERLATEFGVSVRTIKRDLTALENSGVPVWSRPGPGGGYGLATRATLPPSPSRRGRTTLQSMRHVVMLRGVNVGGHNKVPMAELAAALSEKFEDVQTYIQPGTPSSPPRSRRRAWRRG